MIAFSPSNQYDDQGNPTARDCLEHCYCPIGCVILFTAGDNNDPFASPTPWAIDSGTWTPASPGAENTSNDGQRTYVAVMTELRVHLYARVAVSWSDWNNEGSLAIGFGDVECRILVETDKKTYQLFVGGSKVEEEVHYNDITAPTEIWICASEAGKVSGGDQVFTITEDGTPADNTSPFFSVNKNMTFSGTKPDASFTNYYLEHTEGVGYEDCYTCPDIDPCECCEYDDAHETPLTVNLSFDNSNTPTDPDVNHETLVTCGYAGGYAAHQNHMHTILNLSDIVLTYQGIQPVPLACLWQSAIFQVGGKDHQVFLTLSPTTCDSADHSYGLEVKVSGSYYNSGFLGDCAFLMKFGTTLSHPAQWCEDWTNLPLAYTEFRRTGGVAGCTNTLLPTGLNEDCDVGDTYDDPTSGVEITTLTTQP